MDYKLDFSGKSQLYYQIYEILQQDIQSDKYAVGDLLPTELELATKFKVSRITIRNAMNMLVQDKVVSRKRGYGTVVVPKMIEQNTKTLVHFSEEMKQKGHNAKTVMLCNELKPATEKIAEALEIHIGRPLIHVSRLRYSDDVPMCIEDAYFIYDDFMDVYGMDFATISLRKILEDQYGVFWESAQENIFAKIANPSLAKKLAVKEGSPILYVERISKTKNEKHKEFFTCHYRADSYYFSTTLRPNKN